MKIEKIAKIFAVKFGPNNVRVNTEYHIQARPNGDSGWNDIYISKNGKTTCKLHGHREIIQSGPNQIADMIDSKRAKDSDLNAMAKSLNVNSDIKEAKQLLYKNGLEKCCFVDAGWKNGNAKIAAILISKNGDCDVKIRNIKSDSSLEAEKSAIQMGVEMVDGRDIIIFSDCKYAKDFYDKSVIWVPRIDLKSVDKLANLRK